MYREPRSLIMPEPTTSLAPRRYAPRSLITASIRLVLRTVTALPTAVDATPKLLARLPGIRAHEVHIPVADAHTPGTLYLPATAEPRPCVLLMHGTSAWMPLAYLFFIEALLERGIGVLHVDLDGHGRHPHPLSGTGLAQTANAAFTWLAARPEVLPDRLGVMGVSLGGSCALRAAADTGLAKAIGLVSTPVTVSMNGRARLREFVSTLNPEALEGWAQVPPHALLRSLRARIRLPEVPSSLGATEIDLFDRVTEPIIQHAIDELAPLRCASRLSNLPVALVNGAWDAIAPPSEAVRLAEQFQGPCEALIIPRRNHFTIMTSRRGARHMATCFDQWL